MGNIKLKGLLLLIYQMTPIVGLAMGTPSFAAVKQRCGRSKSMMMTLGSGEALLRGQVKSLLQKVEEEVELSKASMAKSRCFVQFQGCVNSPMGILAPTPANTPQLSNLHEIISDRLAMIVFAATMTTKFVTGTSIFRKMDLQGIEEAVGVCLWVMTYAAAFAWLSSARNKVGGMFTVGCNSFIDSVIDQIVDGWFYETDAGRVV